MPGNRPSPRARRRGTVTLARALSKLGVASRAQAASLIAAGRVRIDGIVVRRADQWVVPEHLHVEIDGRTASRDSHRRVLALHKPRGVVTTRHDPQGRPTVFEGLGGSGDGLVAVGRLDLASTGLLLFTNDTRLADGLTSPDSRIPRRYVVVVRGRVTREQVQPLTSGIDVPDGEGGRERLWAAEVQIRKASGRETHLVVTLTQGRNREIRRLFETLGRQVTRLHRIAFGPVTLGLLAPGAWRELDMDEVASLTQMVQTRAR